MSSEEVARGKPAPDVFLEAARGLDLEPASCVAVEDSGNGIRAAHAAGMRVVAIPNRRYPPTAGAVALADVVLESVAELTVEAVAARARPLGPPDLLPASSVTLEKVPSGSRFVPRAQQASWGAQSAPPSEHARVVRRQAHRVRQSHLDLDAPRLVRDVVEVAVRIGCPGS